MSAIKRMFDVRCVMRDGIELSSDVWIPREEGKYPLLLLRTPYLKTSQSPQLEYAKLARFFVDNGYAVAVQDVRGRGDSQGEYGYYFQEADDGYDAVEWMAMQPWSNGRVGMMGPSYLGAVQWLAASRRPPHLVCIAPTAAPGDYFNELPYVGGAFLQYRLLWCNLVSGRLLQNNVPDDEWGAILGHRPLLTADVAMGRELPLYREWLQHSTLDDYWKPLVFTAAEYQKIDIPALHVTGWFDSDQAGVMYHWRGMSQWSPAARLQYLLVGPWDHVQTFCGGANRMGELEFTADAIIDVPQLHLDFFDKYLKVVPGARDFPRVRLYVTGRNEWRDFADYPLATVKTTKLYLSSRGMANSLTGDGSLTETDAGGKPHDRYDFDPRNPVPLDPLTPGGIHGIDRRDLERRSDVLVYTGQTIVDTLEVIGPVSVVLYAATDARDTDFTACLLDVYPDGRALAVGPRVVGIVRARYRNGPERTELLTPGSVEEYHIDLGHVAHAFETGHSIRLEISSSAAPIYNPNQNTGNPVATDVEWRIAHQTIYHDARRPSAVVLPVLVAALGRPLSRE